jgi:predicted negative regulator of RcsB-dependent stress response
MDEEISIIDEKTRNERIKNFFVNNKKKIIISLIIIILIFLSFFGLKEFKEIKKKQISEYYNSVIVDYSNGNLDSVLEKLKEIVGERDPTYSPLSLYFIIDNELSKNREEINELFDILINKTSLEDEIKNLIIYKKALFNADIITENDLLEILKPLINSKSVWNSHALYLIAEYYFFKEEKEKSKEFFNKILLIENANQEIIKEAQKRLNRDLSE